MNESSHKRGKSHPIREVWASLVVQMVKTLPALWESWVPSLSREDPLEKEMATHSIFLPGKSHGQEPGGLQSMVSQTVRHD